MTIECSCGRIASSFVSDEPIYLGEGMCVYCAERIEKFARRHSIQLYIKQIPLVRAPEAAASNPNPVGPEAVPETVAPNPESEEVPE